MACTGMASGYGEGPNQSVYYKHDLLVKVLHADDYGQLMPDTWNLTMPMYPKLSKTRLALYRSLKNAKMRGRRRLFTAEGVKCVSDMMRGFEAEAIVVAEGCGPETHAWLAAMDPERVYTVSEKEMGELTAFMTPSPVLGVFKMPMPPTPEAPLHCGTLYLALDGVRDPGNFGSILRTADWFGIHTVFASRDCADFYNPKCLQAAMGSAAGVKVIYTDLDELADANPGLPVIGTLLEGEDIYQAALPAGGLLVMGNEGKGLSEEVRRRVTVPLLIPPYDSRHGESLNVGAATASVLTLMRDPRRLRETQANP